MSLEPLNYNFAIEKFGVESFWVVEVFYDPAVASVRGTTAFNIGQCMRITGKTKSAIEWYKKALEYLPKDSPYRKEVAEKITGLGGKVESA